MKALIRSWVIFMFVALVSASLLMAQRQAKQAVTRYGVEHYFTKALEAGTQRRVAGARSDTVTAESPVFRAGEFLVTRVAAGPVQKTPTRGDDNVEFVLPDRAFVELVGGTGMLLVPVVLIEGGGLRYDFAEARFRGTIRLGIVDSLHPTGTAALPIPINVLVIGDPDAIRPQELTIDHTNLPFSQVSLESTTPPDFVVISIRTTLHPDGVEVSIPVQRDKLPLQVSPESIQGFGLESATISLGPSADAEGLTVRLSADKGNLESAEVVLSASGTGETTMRSSSWGTATVRATSTRFDEAEVPIEFVFPTLFLVVALLGGAVGGSAAGIPRKGRIAQPGGTGLTRFVIHLVSGMLIGLIVAAAYAVGINLLNVEPTVTTGQAVVFVFAALGGFFGGSVLKSAGPTSATGQGQTTP